MISPVVLDLLQALHTGIAITAVSVLLMYVPALMHGIRPGPAESVVPGDSQHFRPRSRAWFLILGICMTWFGALCSYGWLAFLYWTTHIEPIAQSPSPILLRIGWLAMLLTGGAIHISAAQRERLGVWPTFIGWSSLMAAAVLIMTFAAN